MFSFFLLVIYERHFNKQIPKQRDNRHVICQFLLKFIMLDNWTLRCGYWRFFLCPKPVAFPVLFLACSLIHMWNIWKVTKFSKLFYHFFTIFLPPLPPFYHKGDGGFAFFVYIFGEGWKGRGWWMGGLDPNNPHTLHNTTVFHILFLGDFRFVVISIGNFHSLTISIPSVIFVIYWWFSLLISIYISYLQNINTSHIYTLPIQFIFTYDDLHSPC